MADICKKRSRYQFTYSFVNSQYACVQPLSLEKITIHFHKSKCEQNNIILSGMKADMTKLPFPRCWQREVKVIISSDCLWNASISICLICIALIIKSLLCSLSIFTNSASSGKFTSFDWTSCKLPTVISPDRSHVIQLWRTVTVWTNRAIHSSESFILSLSMAVMKIYDKSD